MNLSIEILTGTDLAPHIDIASQLRIEAFKEYPYLYESEIEYEKQYMKGYLTEKHTTLAIAKIDTRSLEFLPAYLSLASLKLQ